MHIFLQTTKTPVPIPNIYQLAFHAVHMTLVMTLVPVPPPFDAWRLAAPFFVEKSLRQLVELQLLSGPRSSPCVGRAAAVVARSQLVRGRRTEPGSMM